MKVSLAKKSLVLLLSAIQIQGVIPLAYSFGDDFLQERDQYRESGTSANRIESEGSSRGVSPEEIRCGAVEGAVKGVLSKENVGSDTARISVTNDGHKVLLTMSDMPSSPDLSSRISSALREKGFGTVAVQINSDSSEQRNSTSGQKTLNDPFMSRDRQIARQQNTPSEQKTLRDPSLSKSGDKISFSEKTISNTSGSSEKQQISATVTTVLKKENIDSNRIEISQSGSKVTVGIQGLSVKPSDTNQLKDKISNSLKEDGLIAVTVTVVPTGRAETPSSENEPSAPATQNNVPSQPSATGRATNSKEESVTHAQTSDTKKSDNGSKFTLASALSLLSPVMAEVTVIKAWVSPKKDAGVTSEPKQEIQQSKEISRTSVGKPAPNSALSPDSKQTSFNKAQTPNSEKSGNTSTLNIASALNGLRSTIGALAMSGAFFGTSAAEVVTMIKAWLSPTKDSGVTSEPKQQEIHQSDGMSPASFGQPVPTSALTPEQKQTSLNFAGVELRNFSQAAYNKQDSNNKEDYLAASHDLVSAAASFKNPVFTSAVSNLVNLSKDPVRNADAIIGMQGTLNASLHENGLHVEISVEPADKAAPQGRVLVMTYEIASNRTVDVKGQSISVFELKRADGNDSIEMGAMGHQNQGANYAFTNAGNLDDEGHQMTKFQAGQTNLALTMPTNSGLQPITGIPKESQHIPAELDGILRQSVGNISPSEGRSKLGESVANHEAFHVYFSKNGGETNVQSQFGKQNVGQIQEQGAYLYQLATTDPKLTKVVLSEMFNKSLSESGGDTTSGTTRALLFGLQQKIPEIQFFKKSDSGQYTTSIDLNQLPKLFSLPSSQIQTAASAASDDFLKRYLPQQR